MVMVKVHIGEAEWSVDRYLQIALERIKMMIARHWDVCIIIDGLEGSGKSTLAAQIAKYLYPEFTLDDMCFTAEEFRNRIIQAPKGAAVVFDEAIVALMSRTAMTSTNIDLIKVFAEIRQKELVLIIVLPSIFMLDSYVGMHRSRCLIHVYPNKKLQRGQFIFYNYNAKKELILKGKKSMGYPVKATLPPGKFVSFFPLDQEAYNDKKQKELERFLDRKKVETLEQPLAYLLHREGHGRDWFTTELRKLKVDIEGKTIEKMWKNFEDANNLKPVKLKGKRVEE